MAGLNTVVPARDAYNRQIQYISTSLAIADAGVAKLVGRLPAGSMIVKPISGAQVNIVFNAGTTNTIDIGTSAAGTLYSSAGAAGTIAFVPLNQGVTELIAVDTDIYATLNLSGTTATTGSARAVVAFLGP